ncbi:MAG: hypothetical protein OEU26_20285, partial [Candidatus Tectomicrobia bacterium]|nr:hypothetical protein [Candidatus Tectomicrobia bacterium]
MNRAGKYVGILLWGLWLVILSGCSGGSDDNTPSPTGQVQLTGVVDDGTETSPLANAVCRVVDRRGNERARTTADANGVYRLQVDIGVQGYLECGLPTLPDLALSAFISTQKQQSGAQLREDVSPATAAVAMIVQSRFTAESQAVKNQLLNDFQARESKISVLADATTILFNALKTDGIDVKFALAQTDLYADGDLDQSVLQPVALEVKQQVDTIETQIKVPNAFAQLASVDRSGDEAQAPEEAGGDTDAVDGGVEGDADDGSPTSPIAFAACRYTTLDDAATGAVDGAVIA